MLPHASFQGLQEFLSQRTAEGVIAAFGNVCNRRNRTDLEEQTSFLSRIGTVKELERALGGLPFPPPMKPPSMDDPQSKVERMHE